MGQYCQSNDKNNRRLNGADYVCDNISSWYTAITDTIGGNKVSNYKAIIPRYETALTRQNDLAKSSQLLFRDKMLRCHVLRLF